MERTVQTDEARRKLAELIEEAYYHKDHFVIEQAGQAMAVLVPVDYYHLLKRLAKEQVFVLLEEVWQRNEGVAGDELENDIHEALAALKSKKGLNGHADADDSPSV